jgi:drug/metabolite transporter (DMT)-like permease
MTIVVMPLTSSRLVSCLVVLLVTMNDCTNGFVPKLGPAAQPKINKLINQNWKPPPLPPTVKSAFEINGKSDLTNVIVDSKFDVDSANKKSLAWRSVVLGICVVWATNFAVIKEIFQAAPTIDPSLYAAVRFSLAAIVMLPRALSSVKSVELIISSMTIGLSVFLGYFGQAIGLLTTTANKSSFICSLNVVCVALLSSVIKKEFKAQAWISSILAVIGVAVLESDGNSPPVIGDLWSLCQPIGFGVGYVFLEYVVARFPDQPGAVTAYKILSIAIASIVWALSAGHTLADLQPIMESNIAVGGLLYTGKWGCRFLLTCYDF